MLSVKICTRAKWISVYGAGHVIKSSLVRIELYSDCISFSVHVFHIVSKLRDNKLTFHVMYNEAEMGNALIISDSERLNKKNKQLYALTIILQDIQVISPAFLTVLGTPRMWWHVVMASVT